MKNDFVIPADVPQEKKETFRENYERITHTSGRLMLFAGDQKVEHLNDDFSAEGIAADDNNPKHLFQIASQAKIGVFATQLGLIARYGGAFPNIPYLVKLNSKTHLVKTSQKDPKSRAWFDVADVVRFRETSKLTITGVGYTIYIGSEFEAEMLAEAARINFDAHQQGLVTVLWMYPRGKAIPNEKDPHLIAGAAGVAVTLGADFVKVNYPKPATGSWAEALKEAVAAAGNTKLICAGGESQDVKSFLQTLHDQIHISGVWGNATGRNIHQKPLNEAIRFCNAMYAITVENKSVEEALQIYNS